MQPTRVQVPCPRTHGWRSLPGGDYGQTRMRGQSQSCTQLSLFARSTQLGHWAGHRRSPQVCTSLGLALAPDLALVPCLALRSHTCMGMCLARPALTPMPWSSPLTRCGCGRSARPIRDVAPSNGAVFSPWALLGPGDATVAMHFCPAPAPAPSWLKLLHSTTQVTHPATRARARASWERAPGAPSGSRTGRPWAPRACVPISRAPRMATGHGPLGALPRDHTCARHAHARPCSHALGTLQAFRHALLPPLPHLPRAGAKPCAHGRLVTQRMLQSPGRVLKRTGSPCPST